MKTLKTAGLIFLLAVLVNAGSAFGADVTAGVDVNSAYVWRGITFNDGLVLQPSVDVAAGGFGFNVWGNIDLDDYNETLDEGELSEVDLTMTYSFDAGPVGITAGYIEYLFPCAASGGGEATSEIFISTGISDIGVEGFSAGLDVYRDIDEFRGTYASLSVSYGLDIMEKLSMEIGASAGYGDENFAGTHEEDAFDDSGNPIFKLDDFGNPILKEDGSQEQATIDVQNDDGLYDYNVSLSFSYAATDALSLGCFIAYTGNFDEDVLSEQDVDVYGGVNISYAF